ncbi:MAG TPA: copper chaperone PCu(A)C [Ramlibacter sp.]|uniref:copper chaperone PCu(A)C n=1 Tax=Ramlibacter sp. TaxID=1917967 RepID=UPI002D7F9DB2|nr:copper chaperone PCu(A)C [Ramlibacter sp.]HET8744393.1 copper chaperone PCu(A)C [Ramlibacter sp.]
MHRFAIALAALLAAASAGAEVTVQDAWVRATVPGQKSSGAFMQLTSTTDVTLVGARSPVAGVVEIHEMAMDANMTMRMRAVQGIPLPAGKPVALKPGGYHVMLLDLKEPMQAGQKVKLRLLLKDAKGEMDDVDVEVMVKPLNAKL